MTVTTTTTPATTGDRVEEQVLLHSPRSRVWRALTDPADFGAWFGVNLAGATVAPGATLRGNFTIPGHEDAVFDARVEEVVPESRFSWRWHPHAIDPAADYSGEERTLVTFTLEDAADGGTLVRVVETGFDRVPAARREVAFLGNSSGWRGQLQKRLPAYLATA